MLISRLMVVLGVFICLLLSESPIAAATATFTWTGMGKYESWMPAEKWSTPGDWEGAAAPAAADGTVDLTFPTSACEPTCAATANDLEGLTVGALSLGNRVILHPEELGFPKPPPPPGPSAYSISGTQPVVIDEGISLPTTFVGEGPSSNSSTTTLAFPVVLGAPNSWSLENSHVIFSGTLTGSHPLAISLGESGSLQLNAAEKEVGPVKITASRGGGLDIGEGPETAGDLNGTDREPVELENVSLYGRGTIGPLKFDNGFILDGFPGHGELRIDGTLTLEGAAGVEFDPSESPAKADLTTEGNANIDSAKLYMGVGCVPNGSTYTLVEAQGEVHGGFTNLTGEPISNGAILNSANNNCTSRSQSVRIGYTAHTVTATVLSEEASTQQPNTQTQGPSSTATTAVNPSPPPFTAPSAIAALAELLAQPPRHTTLLQILKHGGLTIPFQAPETGTATVQWYQPPTHSPHAKAVLLGTGQLHISRPGRSELKIKLARAGKRLLRHSSRLKITATATFTPTNQNAVTISRTFSLQR